MTLSRHAFCALVAVGWLSAPIYGETPSADPAEIARFFEAEIRPILVERCVECHGPDAQESGIRLDSRADMLKGNDAGPIVAPEAPNTSRLLHAVRYDSKIQMPPDEKLPEEQIAAIEKWVFLGAPWPDEAELAKPAQLGLAERIVAARAEHWSLRPLQMPPLPAVQDSSWPINALDHFILARLEAAGLKPSTPVDRRTWLRRVTYDLTGLPPTLADVTAFEADAAPDAFEKVVDRLLCNPQYGERWGRHWLDVARYADTKGYVFTEDRRYPFSYTYRDYVIRAFNEDLPFERFVSEQIAADLMDLGDDKRALAAMGYLTLGRRFSNNMHDIIDDRIDVVSRGLMGLTVGCARCHDHKYDPIGSADYYALYGVFASCHEPDDKPLIGKPAASEAYQQFEAEYAKRKEELDSYYKEHFTELQARQREQTTKYLLLVVKEAMGEDLPDIFDIIEGEDLHPRMTERWRRYLDRQAKPEHAIFGPWERLSKAGAAGFSESATQLYVELEAGGLPDLNALIRAALLEKRPASMFEVAQIYGDLLLDAHHQFQELHKTQPDLEKLEDPASEALRQILYAERAPTTFNQEFAQRLFSQKVQGRYLELKSKLQEWEVTSPEAPERAMVLLDNDTPYVPHIFARGNPNRPEQEVPRRFVELLESSGSQPFEKGSGRRQLAEKIVAHDNPLTYRVWMNRVWLQHFGSSLVRDPSDFGLRSDPPTHPELLDYLAATFLAEGQSLKRIHRMLVLSNTYRQQSLDASPGRDIDPENRLYWRTNLRRLEFEAYRDSLLFAAGRLDPQLGGRPVELTSEPFTTRRTVYGYIDRQVLPDLFRTFDFASPDASTAQRPRTAVPQQALFAMNSPFAIEQTKRLAARPEIAGQSEPSERVKSLYRTVLAREATESEIQIGCQFVASCGATEGQPLSAWEQYAQVLLMSNEFAFVD